MINKRWQLYPDWPKELVAKTELSPIIGQILYNRGLKSNREMKDFLELKISGADWDPVGDWLSLHNPFLFKDMEKAVDLIIKTIKDGQKIIVYGDYDVDGVTASIVLTDTLKILGAKVDVYLPDRVSEGYGLNKEAINQIKEEGGQLIITVDNGIRNKEEIDYAHSLGLDIIITDHHVAPEESQNLPNCPIIDPAIADSGYPFSSLAGVGVAFKLVSALLSKSKLGADKKRAILERNLDLVALGTVADLSPLNGENRLLLAKGLKILNKNQRSGLKELIKISQKDDRPLEAWNISWQIAPRLNAASRLAHANTAFALLTTEDKNLAQKLSKELNAQNLERQQITDEIIAQVEAGINQEKLPKIIIALADNNQFWNEGVIGLVAGRICDKYYRPTLIVSRIVSEAELDQDSGQMRALKTVFKGSGRSIEGFDLIAAVSQAAEFLDKYGGHPMACGFSIKEERNWEEFVKIIEAEAAKIDSEDLIPVLKLDLETNLAELDLDLAEQLNSLAPFGQGNPQPRLASFGLTVEEIYFVGDQGKHVKLFLSQADPKEGDKSFCEAIFFNGFESCQKLSSGQKIDLAYYLEINEFNGRRQPQLRVIDLKVSEN